MFWECFQGKKVVVQVSKDQAHLRLKTLDSFNATTVIKTTAHHAVYAPCNRVCSHASLDKCKIFCENSKDALPEIYK